MRKHLSIAICFAVITSVISLSGNATNLPLPQSQAVCFNFQFNGQQVEQALQNAKLHAACKAQVESSYRVCGLLSLERMDPITAPNDIKQYSQRASVLDTYSDTFSQQRDICSNEKAKISKICSDLELGLRQARDSNAKQRNFELGSLQPGQSRPHKEADVYRTYGEIAAELTAQLDAVSSVRDRAEKAIDDRMACFALHKRFTQVLSGEMTAISVSRDTSNPPPSYRSPSSDRHPDYKSSDRVVAENFSDDLHSGSWEFVAKESAGRQLAEYAKSRLGPSHVVTITTEEIASTAVTALGRVWTTAVTYLLSASPAGHKCDMIYTDPLKADVAGCPVGAQLNPG